MLIVGLTGSTGSGKGYISDIMKKAGLPCLDTDRVCRDVYRKGEPCYLDLVAYFGKEILREDGEINRETLFLTAFPDKEKYEKLNSIAFFHIMRETEKWIARQREAGERIAVIDAPMLYESGFDKLCDKVICVIADRETQIRRVMKRDGVPESVAETRLSKQKTNSYYVSRSDYVLDNSGAHEDAVYNDTTRLIGVLRRLSADKT